ncbi:MAG: DUF2164 family protein [Fusobacteriaceae bacterium]
MIELSKDEEKIMVEEIKKFYFLEKDEEIGNLSGMILLDFITKKLGKYYYNKGINDARKYFLDKVDEISDIEEY